MRKPLLCALGALVLFGCRAPGPLPVPPPPITVLPAPSVTARARAAIRPIPQPVLDFWLSGHTNYFTVRTNIVLAWDCADSPLAPSLRVTIQSRTNSGPWGEVMRVPYGSALATIGIDPALDGAVQFRIGWCFAP